MPYLRVNTAGDSGTQSFIGRDLWLYTLLVYWTAMTKSMKSVAETVLQLKDRETGPRKARVLGGYFLHLAARLFL